MARPGRDNRLTFLGIELEPRDLWIGLYWKRGLEYVPGGGFRSDGLHVYVCPIPCLVFRWVFR